MLLLLHCAFSSDFPAMRHTRHRDTSTLPCACPLAPQIPTSLETIPIIGQHYGPALHRIWFLHTNRHRTIAVHGTHGTRPCRSEYRSTILQRPDGGGTKTCLDTENNGYAAGLMRPVLQLIMIIDLAITSTSVRHAKRTHDLELQVTETRENINIKTSEYKQSIRYLMPGS